MITRVITSIEPPVHRYDGVLDDSKHITEAISYEMSSESSSSPTRMIENRELIDGFVDSYYQAIKESTNSMIPTFSSTPTGEESGVYLAIDLGGSTFRAAMIEVAHKSTSTISEKSWLIPDDQKTIDSTFFKTMAQRIQEVVAAQSLIGRNEVIHCGITWSFPFRQTRPNNGLMENVGKGYQLTKYSQDQDLKTLLEQACCELSLHICVDAIINDSASVFVAGKFLHDSAIGLVLGTGTNSSISLPTKFMSFKKTSIVDMEQDCMLNTELSFFGHNLVDFANEYDRMIDTRWSLDFKEEGLPHMSTKGYGVFQPLELMTSGRYISELARLQILDKARCGIVSLSTVQLNRSYGLGAQYICDIYENESFNQFESDFGLKLSEKDKKEIIDTVTSIIERAVHVLGLALTGLLELMIQCYSLDASSGPISIGYVGSILQYFHKYRSKLEEFINSQTDHQVRLVYVEKSSINGAAIAASVNQRKVN